ncbi:MAG: DUF2817 domain-containing protein [Bdellovibrio sp.]
MHTTKIGLSRQGKSIEIVMNSQKIEGRSILLMSGLHGDEIEGVMLSSMIFNHLRSINDSILDKIIYAPIANPDGFTLNQRWNYNLVDLNRNWPTKDWSPKIVNPRYPPGPEAESEPETKSLRLFLDNSDIKFVIDLHSYKDSVLLPLFYENSEDLSRSLHALSADLKIPIEYEQDNLGYSISGGFHTWCYENEIQNLTVEVEKGIGQFAVKERYLDAIIKFIQTLR